LHLAVAVAVATAASAAKLRKRPVNAFLHDGYAMADTYTLNDFVTVRHGIQRSRRKTREARQAPHVTGEADLIREAVHERSHHATRHNGTSRHGSSGPQHSLKLLRCFHEIASVVS
jgi:hypothetical protein